MLNEIKIDSKIIYSPEKDQFSMFILDHPLSVCLQVTKKCNYSCPHCLANSTFTNKEDLKLKQMYLIIEKIKDAGIVRIDITGGEPFIRKDCLQILEYAHKLGLDIIVTSNGSLITEEHAEELKKLNALVQISIDGPEEVNDSIRGNFSFKKAVKALKLLQKSGVPVRVNCTLQKKNFKYADEMINLAKRLKADSLYFIIVSAQGRAYPIKKDICLTLSQEKNLRQRIKALSENNKIKIKLLDYKLFESACILIDSQGNFVSQKWSGNRTQTLGNVLTEDIKNMWQKSNTFDHALHLMLYLQHPAIIK